MHLLRGVEGKASLESTSNLLSVANSTLGLEGQCANISLSSATVFPHFKHYLAHLKKISQTCIKRSMWFDTKSRCGQWFLLQDENLRGYSLHSTIQCWHLTSWGCHEQAINHVCTALRASPTSTVSRPLATGGNMCWGGWNGGRVGVSRQGNAEQEWIKLKEKWRPTLPYPNSPPGCYTPFLIAAKGLLGITQGISWSPRDLQPSPHLHRMHRKSWSLAALVQVRIGLSAVPICNFKGKGELMEINSAAWSFS